jgi:DHA1 family bicyclomycin/chloramphenicol resistance-like MFS transporter
LNLPSDTSARSMGKREFIVLISLLMALTALAIDMMLPAFSEMRADFGLAADSSRIAQVVTLFLIGFGVGQLVWGPLSDALGRKRMLWLGIGIYTAAAIGAAFAPSLATLLVLRFVGGVGAASIRVVTQGTIRDRYRGDQMAQVLSYVMAIFLLVPMVAPAFGAAVVAVADWRWVFGIFAVAAVLCGLWALRLPETLPPERRLPLDAGGMVAAVRTVLSSRYAMGFTLAGMAAFGFFASYLASSELIIDDVFGLAPWFPVFFGLTSLLLGAAVLVNPRLIDRFGLRRVARYAMVSYLAATAVFALVAIASGGRPPFWLFVVALVPVLTMHAFVWPNLNSAAMMPMGRMAGTAAAVIGAVATLGGAVIGAAIDLMYGGTITPFAIAGLVTAVLAFLAYRWSDAVWERDAAVDLDPQRHRGDAVPVPGEAG